MMKIKSWIACLFLHVIISTCFPYQQPRCVLRKNKESHAQDIINLICSFTDCSPIKPGGSHFYPDTPLDHANWALTAVFQKKNNSIEDCDFSGNGQIDCGFVPPKEPIRGVNLGGWLILEPYITPSIFRRWEKTPPSLTAFDEYTLSKMLGKENATKLLEQHRSTFVTEGDIKTIASLGLNTIKIPFGYWIFGDVEPYIGGIEHLDRVITLAEKYYLKVILDMHGAPGSQNCIAGSGMQCGVCAGLCPKFLQWDNAKNIQLTTDIIVKIAERYKSSKAVIGIELLNQPHLNISVDVLKKYYRDTIKELVDIVPNWTFYLDDGSRYNLWGDFVAASKNIVLNTQIYSAFKWDDLQLDETSHIYQMCGYGVRNINYMNCMAYPTLINAWSLGTNDCPENLNGWRIPAIADRFYNCSKVKVKSDFFYRQYAAAQLTSFERFGIGWIFWNFKIEYLPYEYDTAREWSYFFNTQNANRKIIPDNVKMIPSYYRSVCDFFY